MELRDWDYTKATFNLVTKEDITIYNFRIVDTGKGPFVGVPQEKGADGNYYNRIGMSRELKDELEDAVINMYSGADKEGPGPF